MQCLNSYSKSIHVTDKYGEIIFHISVKKRKWHLKWLKQGQCNKWDNDTKVIIFNLFPLDVKLFINVFISYYYTKTRYKKDFLMSYYLYIWWVYVFELISLYFFKMSTGLETEKSY